jgi:hypothetical protein
LQARDLAQRCLAEVLRDGPTHVSESGLVRQHPSAKLARDFMSEFRASLRQLALEPEE